MAAREMGSVAGPPLPSRVKLFYNLLRKEKMFFVFPWGKFRPHHQRCYGE